MSTDYTKDDLIAVWRRDMDPGYTAPLESEDQGRGMDVVAGLAAVLERCSQAVLRSSQALYLKPHSTQLAPESSGAVRASGQVQVWSDKIVGGGPILLDTGDLLHAVIRDVNGVELEYPMYEVALDVTIPGGVPGPTLVSVQATRPGFHANITAGHSGRFLRLPRADIAVDSVTLPGGNAHVFADIDLGDRFIPTMDAMVFRFLDGPNAGQYRRIDFFVSETEVILDASAGIVVQGTGTGEVISVGEVGDLRVEFHEDIMNGRSAELDMLAAERGNQGRALEEEDGQFRERVVALPDAVSPNAIIRGAGSVLNPVGIAFQLVEVFGDGVGFVYSGTGLGEDAGHAYDDPLAYRKGRFYVDGPANGHWPIGFIVVVDGFALSLLPDGPDPTLSALSRVIFNLKGGGVPWAIAFEPPLPP